MGWLERVKRNTWVDIYADFDDKGNDVRHVRVRPDDLDRLIAISEGAEWGGDIFPPDEKGHEVWVRVCPICGKSNKIGHKPSCPYHEDWKP